VIAVITVRASWTQVEERETLMPRHRFDDAVILFDGSDLE
jgi:hypothetical protein